MGLQDIDIMKRHAEQAVSVRWYSVMVFLKRTLFSFVVIIVYREMQHCVSVGIVSILRDRRGSNKRFHRKDKNSYGLFCCVAANVFKSAGLLFYITLSAAQRWAQTPAGMAASSKRTLEL